MPDQRGFLRLRSHHVARCVAQIQQRHVVRVAKLHEPRRLVRRDAVDGTGIGRQRLVGEDADAAPAEAGQGGDHRGGPSPAEFEHAALVGEGGDELAHVVGPPPVVGHDGADLVRSGRGRTRGGTVGRRARGVVVEPVRQVALHCGDRSVGVVDHEVDVATRREVLDRSGSGCGAVAAADGGPAHRDDGVAEESDAGVTITDGAGDDGHRRDPPRQFGQPVVDVPAAAGVHHDGWHRQDVVGTGAVAVEEHHQRPAVAAGQVDELVELLLVAVALGALQHAAVVGGGDGGAAEHVADAADEPVGRCVVVDFGGAPGQRAVLDEARPVPVEERREPCSGVGTARSGVGARPKDLIDGELFHEPSPRRRSRPGSLPHRPLRAAVQGRARRPGSGVRRRQPPRWAVRRAS